jgi:hypothetical protein
LSILYGTSCETILALKRSLQSNNDKNQNDIDDEDLDGEDGNDMDENDDNHLDDEDEEEIMIGKHGKKLDMKSKLLFNF